MLNWASFDRIAERKHVEGGLGGFAGALPHEFACDFDEVKKDCCRMRASSLTSVDAVTVGVDGLIYFIEFKDTERFPLGVLRRKAFDSLVLFWMSLGEKLSFDELCQRSVFAYVRPDGAVGASTADDAAISVVFSEDASMSPPMDGYGMPIEDRLNELKQLSLYADVWTISASEFSSRYGARVGPLDRDEFCRRIEGYGRTAVSEPVWRSRLVVSKVSLNSLLTAARSAARSDYIQFCSDDKEGDDFRGLVDEMNEIRCPLSAGGSVEFKRLFTCNAYQEQECRLVLYHDWAVGKFKFTRLINTVFDGFLLWCLMFNPGKKFNQLYNKLSLACVYEGAMPPLPNDSQIQEWQKDFWTEYRAWCLSQKRDADGSAFLFGLGWFVDKNMYKTIKTLAMVDLVFQ